MHHRNNIYPQSNRQPFNQHYRPPLHPSTIPRLFLYPPPPSRFFLFKTHYSSSLRQGVPNSQQQTCRPAPASVSWCCLPWGPEGGRVVLSVHGGAVVVAFLSPLPSRRRFGSPPSWGGVVRARYCRLGMDVTAAVTRSGLVVETTNDIRVALHRFYLVSESRCWLLGRLYRMRAHAP